MIDIRQQYQAIFFLDASAITPRPDNITEMITIFRDKELIPSTFHEISTKSPTPQLRLKLSDPTNEWDITLGSDRVSINKNPISPKGDNLGNPTDFCADAIALFERIYSKYGKKSNRLALAGAYLLPEMPDDVLSEVYDKFFRPPPFYTSQKPFEWNWRAASKYILKIGGSDETLNVITMLNRISGEMAIKGEVTYFDRVQLSFDINTINENSDYRFGLDDIKSFFDQAITLHETIKEEIGIIIDG